MEKTMYVASFWMYSCSTTGASMLGPADQKRKVVKNKQENWKAHQNKASVELIFKTPSVKPPPPQKNVSAPSAPNNFTSYLLPLPPPP